MNSKRNGKVILFAILCCFLLLVPTVASADPMDSILKSDIKTTVKKEYELDGISKYQLDTEIGFTDMGGTVFHALNNMIWMINVFLTKLIILLLEQAFTLDILGSLSSYLDNIIGSVKKSTWDIFSTSFIAFAGLYALWHSASAARKNKAWEQLIVTFILVMIATVVFTKPGDTIKSFNQISRDLSGDILNSTSDLYAPKATDLKGSVVTIGNAIFKNHVKYPWYNLQFGSIASGKAEGSKILKLDYGSEERDELVEEQVENGNKMMDSIYGVVRLLMILLYLLFTLIALVIIGVSCFFMLAYQLLPLILMSFAPVVMVVSLWPGFGLRVVEKWVGRIVSAILNKVVISIFLSIYCLLSTLMYEVYDGNIFRQILALFVCTFLLIMERNSIIGLFAAIPKGPEAAAQIAGQPMNLAQRLGNRVNQVGGAYKTGRKLYKEGKNLHGMLTSKMMRPDAKNYLSQQYHKQKEDAKRKHLETGLPIEESQFVKDVDSRIEQGLPHFTGSQIHGATSELKDIKKQGGDYRQLFLPTGVNTTDPERYADASRKYQKDMEDKQTEFNRKREMNKRKASFAMKELRIPKPVPKPSNILQSEAVKQRQEQAKEKLVSGEQLFNIAKDQVAPGMDVAATLVPAAVSLIPNNGPSNSSNIISDRQEAAKAIRRRLPQDKPNLQSMEVMARQQQVINSAKNGEKVFKTAQYEIKKPEPEVANIGGKVTRTTNGDTILQRQEMAKSLRKMPPKSSFSIDTNTSIKPINTEVAREIVIEGWGKEKGSMSEVQYVDGINQQKRSAYGELSQLKIYQEYEKSGKMSEYKENFAESYSQIQKLKNSTKLETPDLVKLAQSNYDNKKLTLNVAREQMNVGVKEFISVKTPTAPHVEQKIKVRTPSDYENVIMDQVSYPQQVKIQVDQEFKQSVVNDWTKHQTQLGMSKDEYVSILATKKREHYQNMKIFDEAAQQTIDVKEVDNFNHMKLQSRSLYVDAKERHNVAMDLLGVEPKEFKNFDKQNIIPAQKPYKKKYSRRDDID